MPYPEYKKLFQTESNTIAIKILRARNTALILCFLQESFKAKNYSPTISSDILINQLVDFLENWGVSDEEDLATNTLNIEDKAAKYIKDWVKEGYLSLYSDDAGQDLHSLTPDIESVLDWVATLMKKRNFIGMESRFLDIFYKLRELVQNTDDDWQAKITELEVQKSKIDEQIRNLQIHKKVEVFEDYQIKDRFQQINLVARSLLRDFREVEGNFQEITRKIYQKQTEQNQSKGNLLGFSLDALDELRATPQGKTFETFYQHITNPHQKVELDQLVRQVFNLLQDKGIETEDDFLRKIKFYLHSEGQKVNESFYQLVKKLEKIISEKNIRERRKSLLLINDIKKIALELTENPAKDAVFIEIEDRADYISTDSVVLLDEKEAKIVPRILNQAESENTEIPININTIDKSVLIANIQFLLKTRSQVTLQEVIASFGLKNGIAELMAYGSIAANSNKHIISDHQKETFQLSSTRKIDFPEIIFCR